MGVWSEELEVKEILTDELTDIGIITSRFINNLEDLRVLLKTWHLSRRHMMIRQRRFMKV